MKVRESGVSSGQWFSRRPVQRLTESDAAAAAATMAFELEVYAAAAAVLVDEEYLSGKAYVSTSLPRSETAQPVEVGYPRFPGSGAELRRCQGPTLALRERPDLQEGGSVSGPSSAVACATHFDNDFDFEMLTDLLRLRLLDLDADAAAAALAFAAEVARLPIFSIRLHTSSALPPVSAGFRRLDHNAMLLTLWAPSPSAARGARRAERGGAARLPEGETERRPARRRGRGRRGR